MKLAGCALSKDLALLILTISPLFKNRRESPNPFWRFWLVARESSADLQSKISIIMSWFSNENLIHNVPNASKDIENFGLFCSFFTVLMFQSSMHTIANY
jgi:hypothetical protein